MNLKVGDRVRIKSALEMHSTCKDKDGVMRDQVTDCIYNEDRIQMAGTEAEILEIADQVAILSPSITFRQIPWPLVWLKEAK
ncbi:MAG: hypothetical protein V1838_02115 [Patescibacteria group bacterium]